MHCRGTIYFYFLDMTLEATRISNQLSPMPSRLCVLAVEERARDGRDVDDGHGAEN